MLLNWNFLAAKLGLVMTQKQNMKEAPQACEEKLTAAMEENKSLKERVSTEWHAVHVRKQDVQNLHLQLEALTASNQILQARLLLREKSVATTIRYMDVNKSWWVESLFNCSLARQKPELQLEALLCSEIGHSWKALTLDSCFCCYCSCCKAW
jgi:hypothetical protein